MKKELIAFIGTCLQTRLRASFVCYFQDELSSIKKQLLEGFSPDDAYPLGAPLFMETPRPCSPLAQIEFQAFEEVDCVRIRFL